MIIAAVGFAGFLVGAFISAVLGAVAAVLIVRDAKHRRHGWLVFCLVAAVVLPCALLLVHSRPATLNLPNSIDLKGFFLNCIGYAASPGVAAAMGCVVAFIIPRPKRNTLPPPIPNQA